MAYKDPITGVNYPSKEWMFENIQNLPEVQKAYPDYGETQVTATPTETPTEPTTTTETPTTTLTDSQQIWENAAKELEASGQYEVARRVREKHNLTAPATEPTTATQPTGTTAPAGGTTYTVQAGDTLSSIAQKYGVDWRNITGYRSGDPNLIYPGETLTIPTGGAAPTGGTTTGGGITYTVKAGDTLSEIAAMYGVDWRDITGYRSGDPNLIYPGEVLTIPVAGAGTGEEAITTSDQERQQEAETEQVEELTRQEIQDIIEQMIEEEGMQIQTLTNQQRIKELREELGLDPDTGQPLERPAVPDFSDTYEAMRSEYGLPALEKRLNQLNSLIEDTEASLRQGLYEEEGRLAPMEIIGTRQRKLQRQAQEQLDTYRREQQTLVDEISTKQTLISNMMKFEQLDYNNAVDDYNSRFKEKIQLLDIMESRLDKARDIEQQAKDDARANLAIITDLAADRGLTWDDLGDDLRTEAVNLEQRAGLPTGITQAFLSEAPQAELLYTATGTDEFGNDLVTFMYRDPKTGKVGTIETVLTGGYSQPGGGGGGGVAPGGLDPWTFARDVIEQNPDASRDQLYNYIAQQNDAYDLGLTSGEINKLLDEYGVLTPEEQEDRNEDLLKLERLISAYMDQWKNYGDERAGTREGFINKMVENLPSLTREEIRDHVYTYVTDEWLAENEQYHQNVPDSASEGGLWQRITGTDWQDWLNQRYKSWSLR